MARVARVAVAKGLMPPAALSLSLSLSLSIYLFIYLSIYLSLCPRTGLCLGNYFFIGAQRIPLFAVEACMENDSCRAVHSCRVERNEHENLRGSLFRRVELEERRRRRKPCSLRSVVRAGQSDSPSRRLGGQSRP